MLSSSASSSSLMSWKCEYSFLGRSTHTQFEIRLFSDTSTLPGTHADRSQPFLSTSRIPPYCRRTQGQTLEYSRGTTPLLYPSVCPWGCHINSCNNYAEQINLHTWSPPPFPCRSHVSAPPNSPQANNTDIFFLLNAIHVEALLAYNPPSHCAKQCLSTCCI
jgi:hypothetical protein